MQTSGESRAEDIENIGGLRLSAQSLFDTSQPSMPESIMPEDPATEGGKEEGTAQKEKPQVIKKEKEKPEQEKSREAEVDAFLRAPAESLTKIQAAATQMKVMVSQCLTGSIEFVEPFRMECEGVAGKLDRTIKVLSKIAMGQTPCRDRIPKLLNSMQAQLDLVQSLERIGEQRYGLKLAGPALKKRRKTATAMKHSLNTE